MRPQAVAIGNVLKDGAPHRASEFWDGKWGFTVRAVSQRVKELRDHGWVITDGRHGHEVAVYTLIYAPPTQEPSGAVGNPPAPRPRVSTPLAGAVPSPVARTPIPTSDCAGAAFAILTNGQVVMPL